MKLYGRKYHLLLGDREITELRIAFSVERGASSNPDQSKLSIWNLAPDSLKMLTQQSGKIKFKLSAGYTEGMELIFEGKVRRATVERDGPDWVTHIRSGDSEDLLSSKSINTSFKPGAKLDDVVKSIVGAFGGDESVAHQLIAGGWRKMKDFVMGMVFEGDAKSLLDQLAKDNKKEWAMHNGQLVVVDSGKSSKLPAVLLNSSTGLIGSPEVCDDGYVKGKSLLQPGLLPFRKIHLDRKEQPNGDLICRAVTHKGDTHTEVWFSEWEARAANAKPIVG